MTTGVADRLVKCVVWDVDNTLLAGTVLESADLPPADPAMAAVVAELSERGILCSVASRNPPEVGDRLRAAAEWPCEFVAPQYGWGRKSDSLRRVAAELGIGLDALAFVDDDPYERAEVELALPEVLVLSPEDVVDALGWPAFAPAARTEEGRRRADLYAQRKRRLDAARGYSSRAEFLRTCRTEVSIRAAEQGDVPRLHELTVRTHQFNSAGSALAPDQLAALLDSPDHTVVSVRLRDRFGDDGLVGAVVVRRGPARWAVELLAVSCRAMGRGVVEVVLGRLAEAAAAAGARELVVACRPDGRNVPLRLVLAAAGFRAGAVPDEDGRLPFARALDSELPPLPDWVRVVGEPL